MTQLFDEESGSVIPVTVLDVTENVVSRVLKQGEEVTHVEYGKDKQKHPRKVELGNYKSLNFVPRSKFMVKKSDSLEVGTALKADEFQVGDIVDVTGITKGKGFQGVMKRWNFKGEKATHGRPHERKPGSIGSGTTIGRVFKGTKMGGHMGKVQRTTKKLTVAHVDVDNGLIAIRGAVPGNKKGYVLIKESFFNKKS